MIRCIQKDQKSPWNHQSNWFVFLVFGGFSLISALVLVILVGTKTIEWNWLTGYLLGLMTAIGAWLVLSVSIIKLLKDENYFLYYFFYLLRLGIYAAPFLLAFLIPQLVFFWGGVVVGFLPIFLFPFFKKRLIKKEKIQN